MAGAALDLAWVKEFGQLEFLAKQLVEGFITGRHKSPFHGFSVEFAEHRLYNTGESTRHIDWKVFAKTDRLFLKRYEEETNLRCHILLDVSSSMYYPQHNHGKITFSTLAAASLAWMLHKQKDAVSLSVFSDTLEYQTQAKSTASHVHKLLLELERVLKHPKPQKKTSVAGVIHLIAQQIHKRSLVILFSDMFDDPEQAGQLFSGLRHLRHQMHEVLLFHVTDKKTEEDFAFEDRPYEFIDLETGDKVRIQPHEVRARYQETVRNYYQELRLKCGQYRIEFIEADIEKGIEPILATYLSKRRKMR